MQTVSELQRELQTERDRSAAYQKMLSSFQDALLTAREDAVSDTRLALQSVIDQLEGDRAQLARRLDDISRSAVPRTQYESDIGQLQEALLRVENVLTIVLHPKSRTVATTLALAEAQARASASDEVCHTILDTSTKELLETLRARFPDVQDVPPHLTLDLPPPPPVEDGCVNCTAWQGYTAQLVNNARRLVLEAAQLTSSAVRAEKKSAIQAAAELSKVHALEKALADAIARNKHLTLGGSDARASARLWRLISESSGGGDGGKRNVPRAAVPPRPSVSTETPLHPRDVVAARHSYLYDGATPPAQQVRRAYAPDRAAATFSTTLQRQAPSHIAAADLEQPALEEPDVPAVSTIMKLSDADVAPSADLSPIVTAPQPVTNFRARDQMDTAVGSTMVHRPLAVGGLPAPPQATLPVPQPTGAFHVANAALTEAPLQDAFDACGAIAPTRDGGVAVAALKQEWTDDALLAAALAAVDEEDLEKLVSCG